MTATLVILPATIDRAQPNARPVTALSGVVIPDDVHDAIFADAVARGVAVETVAAAILIEVVRKIERIKREGGSS